jgi:hypothetical protein
MDQKDLEELQKRFCDSYKMCTVTDVKCSECRDVFFASAKFFSTIEATNFLLKSITVSIVPVDKKNN